MLNPKSVLIVLLLVLPSVVMAQAAVVLDSSASAYKPGLELATGRSITLKAGEKLTLITESGASIELLGPYNGLATSPMAVPPTAVPQKQLNTLVQRLTAQKAVETSGLGVIRQPMPVFGYKPELGLKSILQSIPVGLNGRFCVEKPITGLYFTGAEASILLQFKFVSGGATQTKSSLSGYQTLMRDGAEKVWNWPAKLSMRGGKYLLRDGNASIPYLIEIVPIQLPASLAGGAGAGQPLPSQASALYLAALLASKACSWQAQVLTQSDLSSLAN